MMQELLKFWFQEINEDQWRVSDPLFDDLLRERFLGLLQQASAGELFAWRNSSKGRLAEIIILDQLSRNIYRDTPAAFAQDTMALVLAQEAISQGILTEFDEQQRRFFLLPYMHSESAVIHEQAEALFKRHVPSSYQAEMRHKVIIDRFGRYPHRNQILGRESTPEELAFLELPGSSFSGLAALPE